MAQIGSTRKRKGIKVSILCILMTIMGICVTTLLLFTRFQQATREREIAQGPPPRTLKEREANDYMKTGRKPQHIDPDYSDRKIRVGPSPKRVQFIEKGLEEYRNHHDNAKREERRPPLNPVREKKTHFYQDHDEHHNPDEDLHANQQVHDESQDESHEDAAESIIKKPMKKDDTHHKPLLKENLPHKEEKEEGFPDDEHRHANQQVHDNSEEKDSRKGAHEPTKKNNLPANDISHHDKSQADTKQVGKTEENHKEDSEDMMDSGDAQAIDPVHDAETPKTPTLKGPVDPRYEWQRTHHWKNAGKNQPKVIENKPHVPEFENPIHFIDYKQLSKQDTFSASWLQRREDFMEMPLEKIMICEDAAWEAWDSRPEQLRMTLDYMDFSVEHLSKWWKFMSFYNTPIAYNSLIKSMVDYIHRGDQFPTPPLDELMMPNTLTMIAFQPYLHKKEKELHYNLTVTSLAATIESIRRAELGRVVVVGMVDNGHDIAQHAFRYLSENIPNIKHQVDKDGKLTKIGHLEVGYARGSMAYAKSKHLAKNIPRAVLYGTKEALLLGDKPASERTANETAYVTEWLGEEHSPSYWKYFYLTEPDTLLNARKTAIPQLKAQLDQGFVLSPHRLQPIPHESDLRGLRNRFRYLNEENGWDKVWEIDENKDVCCDEHKGPDAKPGRDNFPNCGTWWYMCGFKKDFNDKSLGDVHERLRPYSLIKLKGGTGLTLLAGNLFGRRCFPAKDTVCKPPQEE